MNRAQIDFYETFLYLHKFFLCVFFNCLRISVPLKIYVRLWKMGCLYNWTWKPSCVSVVGSLKDPRSSISRKHLMHPKSNIPKSRSFRPTTIKADYFLSVIWSITVRTLFYTSPLTKWKWEDKFTVMPPHIWYHCVLDHFTWR